MADEKSAAQALEAPAESPAELRAEPAEPPSLETLKTLPAARLAGFGPGWPGG